MVPPPAMASARCALFACGRSGRSATLQVSSFETQGTCRAIETALWGEAWSRGVGVLLWTVGGAGDGRHWLLYLQRRYSVISRAAPPSNSTRGPTCQGSRSCPTAPSSSLTASATCVGGGVQFIIKRDIGALFRFAPLQSQTAQRLVAQYGLCPGSLRTMVLIDGGSAFTKSDAALRIASYLPGIWSLSGVL